MMCLADFMYHGVISFFLWMIPPRDHADRISNQSSTKMIYIAQRASVLYFLSVSLRAFILAVFLCRKPRYHMFIRKIFLAADSI
jgi:hypothetical protein